MKKFILTFIISAFICSLSFSQSKSRTYHPPYRHLAITGGYVPDSDFEAFKGMIMVNNFIKQRVGLYYSFENGKDDYSENILGATFGINQYAFVYAGLGLNGKLDGTRYNDGGLRKEAGVGLTPYKFTVATIGWSRGVGMTYTIGVNFTLKDQRDKSYTANR